MLNRIFENKKNIYNIVIALIAGIVLVIIGNGFTDSTNTEIESNSEEYLTEYENHIEEKIGLLLEKVDGVGHTEVKVILKSGREKVVQNDISYETDEKEFRQTKELKSVYNSNDTPFVIVEKEPEIQGAVIVCEGGDNIYVKQKIISAVSALLGVEVHKIEVLKMKTGG
jgi:stage III sporulation protein AG